MSEDLAGGLDWSSAGRLMVSWRVSTGRSRVSVAAKVGLTDSALAKLEHDERRLFPDIAARWCAVTSAPPALADALSKTAAAPPSPRPRQRRGA